MLDNPQDVTFFDFHLIDPKDTPFASFRFHYRSWENLRQLNFIPRDDSSISESFSTTTVNPDLDLNPIVSTDGALQKQDSPRAPFVHPDPDESVFDDSGSNEEQHGPGDGNSKPRRNSTFVLRTPPQLRPKSAASHNLPQPSKTFRDGTPQGVPNSYVQRPLPDRPLPELPISVSDTSWVGPSRQSSTASAAPSVTPSLLSYVREGSFLDDPVEYGQAQEVHVCKRGVPPDQGKAFPNSNDTSMSDHESSSLAVEDPKEKNSLLLSTGNYQASTGSMPQIHVARLEDEHAPSVGIDKSTTPESRGDPKSYGEMGIDFSRFPHLQLSESDWIRRTPSPTTVPRGFLSPRRLWNTLRRNKSRSPLRDVHGEVLARNTSTPNLVGQERNDRHGNWI